MSRQNWLSLLALLLAHLIVGLGMSGDETGEPPTSNGKTVSLEQEIDRIVEAAAIGPLAVRCSDSDFIRRIYLDLTGVIPTTDQARSFLMDESLDKRRRVIEELLSSGEFSRYMTMQLSVLLLERRTEKSVKQQDWERYLFETVADEKPLDQLFSELIFAAPRESAVHPATKFIFNREVEPNALTRDIGRLVFGMDLQCAQCHDHPLIDTYFQADYYGLFAFLQRTSIFTDPTTKEVRLAENAQGEASFKSVFTGDSRDRTNPKLPKEFSLFNEPTYVLGDEYLVKPNKNAAAQPKFSRREALARMLSASEQFQRNLANRVWWLMFSRGIVHPLDFHHAGNAPSNPALLQLLSRALKSNGFQIRPLLRAIALTRTYQRACEAPNSETVNFADVAARATQLSARRAALQASLNSLRDIAAKRDADYRNLLQQHDRQTVEIAKLAESLAADRKQLDMALSIQKTAQETLDKLHIQSRTVTVAATKAHEAAGAVPDDKLLADAAAVIAERASQFISNLDASTAVLAEKTRLSDAAQAEVAQAETQLAAAVASRVDADKLQQLELAEIEASGTLTFAMHEIDALERQIAQCKTFEQFKSVEGSEPAKADVLWHSVVDQWSIAGQVAPLKPLTPEQFTMSSMQATGMLVPQISAVDAQINTAPPDKLKTATDTEKEWLKASFIQLGLIDALRGTMGQFAIQYGGLPGEDFQATVNQALFFGNGSLVEGWMKPTGENLAARLLKIEHPNELADELYLSILSRPALEAEKLDIAQSLKQFEGDRLQTINALMWALLSSNEFRFNH